MKRRLFIGLAALTVCALAVALGGWRNAANTVYRGKSVKAWSLRLYWSDLDKSEATAALHALGPKTVPCLTKLLQARDSDYHKHLW